MATMATDLVKLDDRQLVTAGDALAVEVNALVVIDDESFQRAADLSRRLAGWIKNAEEFFTPIKKSAHATWKGICERETAVIGPKTALKATLGQRMATYEQAQARLRAEAEAAAQRERERLEAEARAQAEAEAERLRKEAEDAVLEAAVDAAESGDTQTAERMLDAPIYIPPVTPPPIFVAPVTVQKPQAQGISFTSTWNAKLVSMVDLVKAAANGNATALSCLKFDEVRANGLARSLKSAMQDGKAIPGVTSVETRTTKTRTA